MIKVFIGYDSNETVAWHVLCHSILKHSSEPVSFIPVARNHIKHLYDKPKDGYESTEFSMTRFLVPHLCDYEGWAIFIDCDMVVTDDIAKLWALRDDNYSIMCTQHGYNPTTTSKFLNQKQTNYNKKNWSSVMMFNNNKCKALTPKYVNYNSGPGIQGAINGCNVLVDNSSLAYPVSIRYSQIENPPVIDREEWFVELCHTEYFVQEIEQGLWYNRIKKAL
jgi:hypothetical protein